MSRFGISFALAMGLLIAPVAHAADPADAYRPRAKPTANCFGNLKGALEKGGFDAGCDGYQRFEFTYVGQTAPPHVFQIYSLKYITTPPETVEWGHGGQRIFLFNERGKYVGHYHLGGFHRVWVSGHSVHINGPRKWGNAFRLDKADPPPEVHLDGDLVGLAR